MAVIGADKAHFSLVRSIGQAEQEGARSAILKKYVVTTIDIICPWEIIAPEAFRTISVKRV